MVVTGYTAGMIPKMKVYQAIDEEDKWGTARVYGCHVTYREEAEGCRFRIAGKYNVGVL
jgi:hypothetical protein